MKKNLLLVALLISGASFGQVLTEDFEGLGGALPAGWVSTTVAAGAWETGDDADANAGGYWPVPAHTDFAQANDDVCNCDMSAVYLTSPSMDFTGLSGVTLAFDAFEDGGYNQNPYSVELSIDGGSTWNNIFTGTIDAAQWNSEVVALGASTDGLNGVQIRFKYDDNGQWASGSAIDNVIVQQPLPNDAALSGITLDRWAGLNANLTLGLDVTNMGSNAITSITVDWNDGVAHSQTIAVNIAAGASANVNHPDLVTYATAVEKNIAVTITQVNGGADDDVSNNSDSGLHNTLSQIVQKNVVIEEGTGTWCGWCPRGAVAMDYMAATYPNQFIGVAVHNGDPMTVTAYDNGASFGGFPSSNVDRVLLDASVSQTNFVSYFNSRKDLNVPAGLSIVSSGTGANAVIDVTATFYTPIAAANYRLAVVISEDDVTGTSSGYNQTNYYSGGANGVMGGYEALADPVPAADMVYDHVGRALLGGYNGQAGTVPGVITDGLTASYTFNYTVPGTSTRANMHAVALLIDQSTGEIINAGEISIEELGLSDVETISMSVYPNPADDILNVSFELEGDAVVTITDMQGRVVISTEYSNLSGAQNIALPIADLVSGNYILSVATEGASYNEVVVIK